MCISKFQLLSQIYRGARGETALFEVKKGENPISPLLIDWGGGVDFLICFTNFDFVSIGLKRVIFYVFDL